MTDISKLGEFGLIDRLTKDIKPKNESTIYGVGDDCAVLNYPDTRVLTTTDMLMEGVHFDLTYITMQQLGYKAAMVNLSDVFAMNGSPRQLLVSLAVDKRFDVESIDDFYTGLRQACDKWNVDIIGGHHLFAHRSCHKHHLHRRSTGKGHRLSQRGFRDRHHLREW